MRFRSIVVGLVCLLFLSLHTVLAQQPTGTIEGTIIDEQKSAISGAKITITEKSTSRIIETTTNQSGFFIVRSLTAGGYDVKIQQTGFAIGLIQDLVVQIGQVSNAGLTLKIGSPTETIQVIGTSAQLQVDTSRQTIDGVVTPEQILNMPLNQRNFLDLATLQPGVVTRDGGMIDPTKSNAYRAVTVNGASGTATRVQIDGIDVTDETVGSTTANISTDAVQEFQLSRASFDLSTSLTTSGAVNIVTMGGTNQYHGSGFYFWRGNELAARPDFLTPEEHPDFYRHQTGYKFGGPIKKDKLFFFSNLERTYQGSQDVVSSANFPNLLSGAVGFPVAVQYIMNKLEYAATDNLKLFYSHRYNGDLSTGGDGASPFQNVDWTNVHVVGADVSRARTSHTFRFGYVNFNNRIESQELDPFNFLRSGGVPYNLNVGDFTLGPNSLAPQQTYQDNFQSKYDGSLTTGNHVLRFGGEVNRIILGGFANFAGPLTINGTFTQAIRDSLPESQKLDPLAYPLDSFGTGPNAGFFTVESAHNLPHGGKRNTRLGMYFGDNWKLKRNFSLNLGTRWQFDSGYLNTKTPELKILNVYGEGMGKTPKFPKTAFSPQVGFAWDVTGNGKTSIRAGFYLSYEMNIFNNALFDEFSRTPPGIGPTALSFDHVVGPDGTPINIGGFPDGDYSALLGQPINSVLPTIVKVHQAVQSAYSSFQFDPTKGVSEFENTRGVTFGGVFPGSFEIPYGMQFSLGIQREIMPNFVVSADYVRIRSVGLPFLLTDFERRRDASTLNSGVAQGKVNSFLTNSCQSKAIDAAIATGCLRSNGTTFFPTIANFSLGGDDTFTGLNPHIDRASLLTGGYSTYQGLQFRLDTRLGGDKLGKLRNVIKGLNMTAAYALAKAESTNGSARTEFLNNTLDNRSGNLPFGPSGLDRKHILTVGALMDIPWGFQLNQIWSFQTATPRNLFVPAIDTFSSVNRVFTTDINGDGSGGAAAPRADILPGTQIGALGRNIKNFEQLNDVITNFNTTYAGKLTPHGQALVSAGIFNEAQLRALGATIRPIPLVPLTNDWPFNNRLNLDLRVSRPIKIGESVSISPAFEIFNVFNHTPLGQYTGLGATSGSLNFDYADPSKGFGFGDLNRSGRLRIGPTRMLQFGIRVTF